MKKVVRFFAAAAFMFGMTAMVACGDDNGGEGGGNSSETGDPVLLDEGFEGGIPDTWTNIDADGDGLSWMAAEGMGVNGSNAVVSISYDNQSGPINADNYLVSPTIHIPGAGGYTLTYSITNQQAEYPDQYSCVVGTLENGTFSPIETLVTERVTTGRLEETGYTAKSFNLDAFKGQDICVAFHHQDYDAFVLCLDNVKISNEAKGNVSLASSKTTLRKVK